jgi:NAD(P)H-hydrate epimerase
MNVFKYADPVLTCRQAKELESLLLKDESSEWAAMKQAGESLARLVVRDYAELRPLGDRFHVLALVGKGHNGGDALIACLQLLADFPRTRVDLLLTAGVDTLRPLAARALHELEGRVHVHPLSPQSQREEIEQLLAELAGPRGFQICIDGLLGMSFQSPLRAPLPALIHAVNGYAGIDLRASVDLPSGRGDSPEAGLRFKADFTYATGIVKKTILEGVADCGRVRYIDLGFFKSPHVKDFGGSEHMLKSSVLDPVRQLRPATVDKRQFGHLFIVGGSAYMPGALLMAVQAAVRSGVGLVTAFAPASVASGLAAQVPEAMWVPWPETSHGTLNPRALPLLLDRIGQASAVLVGPGMGKDRNTEMLVQEIVKLVDLPVLLDADALRVRVMELARKRREHFGRVVLTPHMGEFMRIAKLNEPDYANDELLDFSETYRVLTVLKGPITRICDGESVIYSMQGGPVLSRGGSGDLLSGLISGMMAQHDAYVPLAVAQGLMLHGQAAQRLARAKGQVAVHTTQLLDYLPEVLRS